MNAIRRSFCAVFLFCSSAAPFLLVNAYAADTQTVHVDNFPSTQDVRGSVAIDGTVSHARDLRKEGILTPPSRRTELSELTFAGMLDAAGFTSVTISLQGEIKSSSYGAGDIGVLLVPDEEPVMRALREGKQVQFAIESVHHVRTGDPVYFGAEQVSRQLAFPRYKIYLYNTLAKSVEANIYFHLTN